MCKRYKHRDAPEWAKALVQHVDNRLNRMEQKIMSELRDALDAALATLASETSDWAAKYDAAIAATQAAAAILKTQLDNANAEIALDTAELEKVLAGLNAANAALALMQPPVEPPPVVDPVPLVVATPSGPPEAPVVDGEPV